MSSLSALVCQEFEKHVAKVRESRVMLARARALAVEYGYSAEVLAKFDETDVKFAELEASYQEMVDRYS